MLGSGESDDSLFITIVNTRRKSNTPPRTEPITQRCCQAHVVVACGDSTTVGVELREEPDRNDGNWPASDWGFGFGGNQFGSISSDIWIPHPRPPVKRSAPSWSGIASSLF